MHYCVAELMIRLKMCAPCRYVESWLLTSRRNWTRFDPELTPTRNMLTEDRHTRVLSSNEPLRCDENCGQAVSSHAGLLRALPRLRHVIESHNRYTNGLASCSHFGKNERFNRYASEMWDSERSLALFIEHGVKFFYTVQCRANTMRFLTKT